MTEHTCVQCNSIFTIEKKPGRPSLRCNTCRGITAPKPKQKLPKKDERLYSRLTFLESLDEFRQHLGQPGTAREIAALLESIK